MQKGALHRYKSVIQDPPLLQQPLQTSNSFKTSRVWSSKRWCIKWQSNWRIISRFRVDRTSNDEYRYRLLLLRLREELPTLERLSTVVLSVWSNLKQTLGYLGTPSLLLILTVWIWSNVIMSCRKAAYFNELSPPPSVENRKNPLKFRPAPQCDEKHPHNAPLYKEEKHRDIAPYSIGWSISPAPHCKIIISEYNYTKFCTHHNSSLI